MRNIKLLLEYDGTNFVGWQTQENGRSVQEEITKVLSQVLQEPINLIGAGRTDSGVHARGQVANFRSNSTLVTKSILSALNGMLPDDISVRSAVEVHENFHARYDARGRVYRYYISQRPLAIGRQYHWHVKQALDLDVMNALGSEILGEHDFESFCKSVAELDNCRCTVSESKWEKIQPASSGGNGTLVYEICANRFLHGMVRSLVGTMVDIGRGSTPASAFQDIMSAKDRRKAGMTAPPHGLFLEEVRY